MSNYLSKLIVKNCIYLQLVFIISIILTIINYNLICNLLTIVFLFYVMSQYTSYLLTNYFYKYKLQYNYNVMCNSLTIVYVSNVIH